MYWRGLVDKTAVVVGLGILLSGPSATAQAQQKFQARLSTVPMDLSMRSVIAGQGSVTAVLSGIRLTITGTFEGLRSPATGAQLHRGRVTGLRGTPLFDLNVTQAVSGMLRGSFDLTPGQVESLRKGELYVQLNSEKATDGNLWGWLLRERGSAR